MKPYFCFSCMKYKSNSDFKSIGELEVCKKCYEEDRPTYGSYGSVNYGQIISGGDATFLMVCGIGFIVCIIIIIIVKYFKLW